MLMVCISMFCIHALQHTVSECDNTAFKPLAEAPLGPSETDDTVQWTALSTTYGWSTPGTRPNYADDITSVTGADDFFSLMCNSWTRVRPDRKECIKDGADSIVDRYGATHMRYDCATKSLWILTYMFKVSALHARQSGKWLQLPCGCSIWVLVLGCLCCGVVVRLVLSIHRHS